jgi:phosphoribosylformylglycinamidine (FGAM) synthase-like amidotransferase family enzyme
MDLEIFHGLAIPGGFAFSDVFGSGARWPIYCGLSKPALTQHVKRSRDSDDTTGKQACEGGLGTFLGPPGYMVAGYL